MKESYFYHERGQGLKPADAALRLVIPSTLRSSIFLKVIESASSRVPFGCCESIDFFLIVRYFPGF